MADGTMRRGQLSFVDEADRQITFQGPLLFLPVQHCLLGQDVIGQFNGVIGQLELVLQCPETRIVLPMITTPSSNDIYFVSEIRMQNDRQGGGGGRGRVVDREPWREAIDSDREEERRRKKARFELEKTFPDMPRNEVDSIIKSQFGSEVRMVGEYSAGVRSEVRMVGEYPGGGQRAAKRGSADMIEPMNKKKGKEEAGGMRTDSRYNDNRMNLKVTATATVQGNVQRQVARTNTEEKDNGRKGDRSTRDVRAVDAGKNKAGKSKPLPEHGEEPSYCLHLQTDGEGLGVPDGHRWRQ